MALESALAIAESIHCDSFELEIAPHPGELAARVDYFGNKQHIFTLREPHRELRITSRSLVRRDEPALPMAGSVAVPTMRKRVGGI